MVVQDRTVYQDEFGQNYLYRVSAIKDYFRYWAVSPWESDDTFGNPTRSMILSSASCPVRAAIFQNPKLLYPYLTGIISWTNCALQCVKEPKCHYWIYSNIYKTDSRCGLITDYESIISLPGTVF